MSTQKALDLIKEARKEQQLKHNYTHAHDDRYVNDELARAASCYATPAGLRGSLTGGCTPRFWPWDTCHWKPSKDDRMSELVKAGALIVAEMERLMRAAAAEEQASEKAFKSQGHILLTWADPVRTLLLRCDDIRRLENIFSAELDLTLPLRNGIDADCIPIGSEVYVDFQLSSSPSFNASVSGVYYVIAKSGLPDPGTASKIQYDVELSYLRPKW